MRLEAFVSAGPVIQAHLIAALTALARTQAAEVETYLKGLTRSDDSKLAVGATKALAELGTESAARTLSRLADAASHPVRLAAVGALALFELPWIGRRLEHLTNDKRPDIARAAVHAIGAHHHRGAADFLGRVARHGHRDVKGYAVHALQSMATSSAIRALVQVFRADDPSTVSSAAYALSQLATDESLKALFAGMSGSRRTQHAVLSALGALEGHPKAAEILTRAVQSSDRQLVSRGAYSLAKVMGTQAVSILEHALENAPRYTESTLIGALASIPHRNATKALQRLSVKGSTAVQIAAIQALTRRGALSTQAAREMLMAHLDKGGAQRHSVVYALVQLRDPKVNAGLIQALEDHSARVRRTIISALVSQGGAEATAALLGLAKSERRPKRRNELLTSLAGSPSKDVRAYLIQVAAEDSDEGNTVLQTLAWRAPNAVGSLAKAAMSSENPARRRAALNVLGQLGKNAPIDLIKAGLADTDAGVRSQAISALGSLGTPESKQVLVDGYRDGDAAFQASAAYHLGASGHPDAFGLLTETLEKSATGRYSAYYGLTQMGSKRVMTYLRKVATEDSDLGRWVSTQLYGAKGHLPGIHGRG